MLHPIEPRDRAPARRCDAVDLVFGVESAFLEERRGAARRLGGHEQGLLGVQPDLDPALGGRADRTQKKGDAAGGKRGRGRHLFLGDDQRPSHRIEQRSRRIDRRTAAFIRRQAGHRLADRYGRVGHRTHHGYVAADNLPNLRDGHAAHDRDQDVPVLAKIAGDLAQNLVDLPRFHRHKNHVGPSNGFTVSARDSEPALTKRLEQLGPAAREHDFGRLEYRETMRWVIPGATLTALGFQTVLASFFVSILGLKRR